MEIERLGCGGVSKALRCIGSGATREPGQERWGRGAPAYVQRIVCFVCKEKRVIQMRLFNPEATRVEPHMSARHRACVHHSYAPRQRPSSAAQPACAHVV